MRLIGRAVAILGVYGLCFGARQAVDGGTKASQETMTSAVCRLEMSYSVSGQGLCEDCNYTVLLA